MVPNKGPSDEITGNSYCNEYSGDEFLQLFYQTKVNVKVFLYLEVCVLLSN